MNKIICDICGTSYPETAEQCPICGCAKDVTAQALAEEIVETEETTVSAQRPKGGRFAASNVRKRKPRFEEKYEDEDEDDEEEYDEDEEEEESKSNAPLVVLLVIVIAALLAVTGFIFVKYFLPNMGAEEPAATTTAPVVTTTEAAPVETTELTVPCTSLVLTSDVYTLLEEQGFSWLIHVTALPENTTDEMIFTSSDESIAVVGPDGTVTAVGEGVAVITITCGTESIECNVVCDFDIGLETTAPDATEQTGETEAPDETEAPEQTTAPTEALLDVTLTLNRSDMTFSFKGESFKLGIPGELDYEDITWTSDNANIAKVENGVVTATGYGTTKIYAQYGDQKVQCIVRCIW